MNELKIDPELRDLLPPLSGDEKRQLEDNLLKIGYVGGTHLHLERIHS